MRRLARSTGLAAAGVMVCALPQAAVAQATPSPQAGQTVTVVAGEQYGKPLGGTFFWGKDYRDLWTAPIRVEVLDLRTFAGGLQIVRVVGGNESRGLALHGADGLGDDVGGIDGSDRPRGRQHSAGLRDESASFHGAPRSRRSVWGSGQPATNWW